MSKQQEESAMTEQQKQVREEARQRAVELSEERQERYDNAPLEWLKTSIQNKYADIHALSGGLGLIYGESHPLGRYGRRLARLALDLHVYREITYDKKLLEDRNEGITKLLHEIEDIYRSVKNNKEVL